MSKFGKPYYRFKCGEYADVSGYLGPIRMIGFFVDILCSFTTKGTLNTSHLK